MSNTIINTEIMNASIAIQQNPFIETAIQFESRKEEAEAGELIFGKILLNPTSTDKPTNQPLDFAFWLDNSASMDDRCSDGRTKLNNMIFAISNALRYLVNHNIPAKINLHTFDDRTIEVIPPVIITSENIEPIIEKINKIKSNGSTNIEGVLQSEIAHQNIEGMDRIFAMFTDGRATAGRIADASGLVRMANKINDSTTIATFGCGQDHDYYLLSGIAKKENSTYKFIGKIEESALVIGEFLDKILYKLLVHAKIRITNGEIYDWKSSTWTGEISIENIITECNKTYHIRSATPDAVEVTVLATMVETGEPFEHTISSKIMDQDLRKDIFRQKTLEILYEANQYNQHQSSEYGLDIKSQLRDLLKSMKQFMDENSLREDLFMKLLCDDIVIAFKTLGSPIGLMYTNSRHVTQGTQSIHSNVIEESDMPDMPILTRGLTTRIQQMDNSLMPKQPVLKRGVSLQLAEMEDDIAIRAAFMPMVPEDDNEEEDDGPGDLMNCSMLATPALKRSNAISYGFPDFQKQYDNTLQADDDLIDSHQTLASDISPYENCKTMKLMREVSYTPPKDQDKDQEPNP